MQPPAAPAARLQPLSDAHSHTYYSRNPHNTSTSLLLLLLLLLYPQLCSEGAVDCVTSLLAATLSGPAGVTITQCQPALQLTCVTALRSLSGQSEGCRGHLTEHCGGLQLLVQVGSSRGGGGRGRGGGVGCRSRQIVKVFGLRSLIDRRKACRGPLCGSMWGWEVGGVRVQLLVQGGVGGRGKKSGTGSKALAGREPCKCHMCTASHGVMCHVFKSHGPCDMACV
jgi:hypothetical protein